MAESIAITKLDFAGFQQTTVDKVNHLLIILNRIYNHPYLKDRVCLHGGTAINLFFLKTPRLSVDIDLNYIGSTNPKVMLEERPMLEQGIVDIGKELGFDVRAGVFEHSGRSFRLCYKSAFGTDNVKIDLDYLNRSPLLPPVPKTIETPERGRVTFSVNADIELIGGKIKALLSRIVPRDLYDIYRIAEIYPSLTDSENSLLFRRILLYYASLSAPFPKPFDVVNRFSGRDRDVEEQLYPMLLQDEKPNLQLMIEAAAPFISTVTVPQDSEEKDYLRYMAKGTFKPELLFGDFPETLAAARNDPVAKWKMQNIVKMNKPAKDMTR